MSKTVYSPSMKTLPLARGIPRSTAATIGRIAIRAAEIEFRLLVVKKRLVGVGMKEARLVFRTNRWEKDLDQIEILAEMKHVQLGLKSDLKALRKLMGKAQDRRNAIVHSAWLKDGKLLGLQYTKENYPSSGIKCVLQPEFVSVTRTFLDESTKWLDVCVKGIKALESHTKDLVA